MKTKMKADKSGLLSSVWSTSVCYLALSRSGGWSVFSYNIFLLADSSRKPILAPAKIRVV